MYIDLYESTRRENELISSFYNVLYVLSVFASVTPSSPVTYSNSEMNTRVGLSNVILRVSLKLRRVSESTIQLLKKSRVMLRTN